jgi:hypothetical protein
MAYFDYAKWQILTAPIENMWVGYILVTKMGINWKLCTNGQHMKSYMLIVYIIHVKCDKSSFATNHYVIPLMQLMKI